jgi:uncharacterized membrane protein (DUF4010 family)
MELAATFQQLAIALGLGLLVGLQRERTNARLAGVRTFPLITLCGTLSGLLSLTFGVWIVAVALGGLIAVVVVGNLPSNRPKDADPGLTSEAAMLVMFLVGAMLVIEQTAIALAVGGMVALLLHWKPEMHRMASRIGEKDFKAIMQFVLIALVILPVLPNQFYGPYQVLNPFKIWLMVVLIVGISLGGYIAYKVVGPSAGSVVSGVLGGLISSTATTVSYSRRSKAAPQSDQAAAFVILTASAVVFARVLALVAATAPGFFRTAALPLLMMFFCAGLAAIRAWVGVRASSQPMPDHGNPTELKPAILFAVLFAVVLMAVAAARDYLGQSGLYVVAILSGLTDMDAITLSVTQLVNSETLPPETGWRLILVASMANLVFKAGIVAIIGNHGLARHLAMLFGLTFLGGVAILMFWPG